MTRFCPKCQIETERNTKGDCKACAIVRVKKWVAENREKHNQYCAIWQKNHPEKNRKKAKKYRERNHKLVLKREKEKRLQDPAKYIQAARNYAKKYPEKIREMSMAYRKSNPEKVSAATKLWRSGNTEKIKAYNQEYSAENPEARRIYRQNREARKRENGGVLSKGLAAKLFKLQKGKCPCCKQPLGVNFHLDHVVPIALGGSNTDNNIQLLRQRCNNQKHAKDPIDFMQQRGFLL